MENRRSGVFDSWLQLALTVGVAVTLIVGLTSTLLLLAARSTLDDSRRTGLENRGALCTVAQGLRMQLPQACLDKRIAPYFDRTAVIVSAQPSPAVCAIAKQLAVSAPGCS